MARTTKISVTIDRRVLAELKQQLRRREESLSAYVSDAIARAIRSERMRSLLDADDRALGPVAQKERRAARAKLAAALGSRRRSKAA